MRINLDSDGVIYDLQHEMVVEAEILTGKQYDLPDRWAIGEAWGVSGKFIHQLFGTPGIFGRGGPYPGAVRAVRQLVETGHDVRIVTHKHGLPDVTGAMSDTVQFYDRIGLLGMVDIVFARGNKTAYPADVVVDDKPNLAWTQPGAVNILFNQPWNQLTEPVPRQTRLWRAADWAEVLLIVEQEDRL